VNGWWYVGGALTVIGTVLYLLAYTKIAAANPSARLPWFGRAPSTPH
jgi:hypothetical protein